jgi:arylsulfatase A-like enzyme
MCSDTRRVLFPNSVGGLPPEEITLAEALKPKGYATACIGKWHLGHRPEYLPRRHGFDFYFGLPYSNDMQNKQRGDLPLPLMRNEQIIEQPADQTTLTRRYTEEAIQFIRNNRQQPFFLYLPHTFPHTPLAVSKSFAGASPRGLYGDVVEELDWSVGQVLQTLRQEGLAENTLVFFTSDNGPWLTQRLAGGSAGLLREGKGSTWEGGMREPCLAWWPGRIKASAVNRSLACTMDIFVTCLFLAQAEIPKDRIIDGVNLAPMLLENGPGQREVFFYYRDAQLYAVRKGAFKAHYITRSGYGKDTPEKHEPPLLYHLGHDPSEQYDVAKNYPHVLAEIAQELEQHRAALVPGKPQLDQITN